jgi:hypothetical protein
MMCIAFRFRWTGDICAVPTDTVAFGEPVESGYAFLGPGEVKGEGGWLLAERMVDGHKEPVTIVSRVEGEQEATAGGVL